MIEGDTRYPITVITGFLGSGKTTLLSNILKHDKYKKTAIIINEYGEAGLDHKLIRRIEEKTRLLSGGCICCNMRDDLINELKELLNATEREEIEMDRVVIETTGLADPAPILFSILMDPLLTNRFYVEGVVCCLDAANGELHLKNHQETIKQIVTSDTVIVTKCDIVEKETITQMHERLHELNPAAIILNSFRGVIEPDAIFSNGQNTMEQRLNNLNKLPSTALNETSNHGQCVRSMSVEFYQPLDWTAFGLWMSMLLYTHGEKIMRIKGMIDVGDNGPVVINGVQHIIHPPHHLDDWNGEKHVSQIVFIMKELKPKQILNSLVAFQSILGSAPKITEVHIDPYSKGA